MSYEMTVLWKCDRCNATATTSARVYDEVRRPVQFTAGYPPDDWITHLIGDDVNFCATCAASYKAWREMRDGS